MGLPNFIRRLLGPASFPRMEGQELPRPVERDKRAPRKVNPAERKRALDSSLPTSRNR